MWIRHNDSHSSVDSRSVWCRVLKVLNLFTRYKVWRTATRKSWWRTRAMVSIGICGRICHINHRVLNTNKSFNFQLIIKTLLYLLSLLEELGRGLTHDEWGESWVVCRRLESWGAYGEEFMGKVTGMGDMPEDWVSPEVGVDWI